MQHVLVIEDQVVLARWLGDIVWSSGIKSIDLVHSVDSAVKSAILRRPTIIVSDADLNEGGNGPDAVARIRMIYGHVPALFVTAHVQNPDVLSQATAILPKPCTASQLTKMFASVLSSSDLNQVGCLS